jgi:phenylalanyl-tRNA synthetase beta chain
MEVYHSSFVGPQDYEFTEKPDDYVTIDNPSNDECEYLRQNLISNFVRHLKPELRAHGEVNFFELGKTYHAPTNEIAKLALFSAKLKGDTEKMFYEMKANLVELCEFLGIEKRDLDFRPAEKLEVFCHPHRCAEIFAGNEKIGCISVIHPEKNSVKNSAIVFTEVETEKIQKFAESCQKKYQKISNFPSVHRDISILVERKTLVGDLIKIARKNSEFLTDIELFDDFVNEEKFGKGLKNLAFHLTFKSREKTLEEKEIEQNFNNILEAWAKKFGAKLRLEFDSTNAPLL